MSDTIQGTDKMLLGDFVKSISQQYLQAIKDTEKQFPDFMFPNINIVVRAVIKPGIDANGNPTVIIDVNEPKNEPISEIPISIRRVPSDDTAS